MINEKSFYEKCYSILKKVPKGKITTYKEIAKALGTKAYRAVGNAMNKNPYAYVISPEAIKNRRSVFRGDSKRSKSKDLYFSIINSEKTNGFFLVPCHRVVNSNGNIGGFASGNKKKIEMLKKEGIKIKGKKIQEMDKVLYRFN